MAFESLTERLQNVFKNLRKKGKISESDVQEASKEIRLALLEADVALPVVKDFIKKVRERAVGHEVIDTLNPAQQIIKIVDEELTAVLGSDTAEIIKSPKIPTIIMMVGLQGAGNNDMLATTDMSLAAFNDNHRAIIKIGHALIMFGSFFDNIDFHLFAWNDSWLHNAGQFINI